MLGYLSPAKKHMSERVISPDGCCFTLLAMTHGYGQGYIMEYESDIETGTDGVRESHTEEV